MIFSMDNWATQATEKLTKEHLGLFDLLEQEDI